ncbi:MAG: ribbon-helix-helix protein, CopG family [Bacillota bacterium]
MIGQEKITINLNAVDLAKVDYLAEQGFYSSRSDFIRTAIRNQLREHDAVISDAALTQLIESQATPGTVKTLSGVGIFSLSARELSKYVEQGQKLRLFVFGALVLARDVKVELLEQAVDSVRIYGAIRGPQAAVDYVRGLRREE